MATVMKEIQDRRARRALDEAKDVPREVVDRMLEAAHMAASCSNKQPWRFLVGDADPVRQTLRDHLLGGNYWAQKAPVLMAVATRATDDARLDEGREYAPFDTGMAVAHLLLQATHEGLIAHPMAGFKPGPLKKELGLPDDVVIYALIAVGYPGDESHLSEKHLESEHSERDRKPIEDVASREAFPYESE